ERREVVHEVARSDDGAPVHGGDDVPGSQASGRRRAARSNALHLRARLVDRRLLEAYPEVGVLHGPARLERRELGLDRVDRHREPYAAALVGPGPTGRDLIGDPHDLSPGVEHRAARVTRIERRVGLERVCDEESVGSLDRAAKSGYHARAEAAVISER